MKIVERRKIYYLISIIVLLPGLISLFINGLNLGIDFRGGSEITVKIASEPSIVEVRTILTEIGFDKAEIQVSGDHYIIRTPELSQEESRAILTTLSEKYESYEFLGNDTVGAIIGKELVRNAIIATILAAILMGIYIAIRFEWRFGIAAIVSEVHDILFVLGIFSIFQWEVNTPFIAAILTVVGFSLNDTIVIFDRIRENLRNKRKEDYAGLINKSIMQSLNRSINTVLTCVFALVALYIWGGASLQVFVLAMLIGFVVGACSSIFIASPIWYEIRTRT